ncbi:hypothetical protein DVH24_002267 [Malus domestica]|uniref:Uncharacterized protein n=1 Tax=Malus domestica TaxID=3750 RepID=A0A498I789_MALDO|nr:hypothetical protein DVH24_002267 [Malus domestica]
MVRQGSMFCKGEWRLKQLTQPFEECRIYRLETQTFGDASFTMKGSCQLIMFVHVFHFTLDCVQTYCECNHT